MGIWRNENFAKLVKWLSDCVWSHIHLKEFKLHFNYFPILDTTVTELNSYITSKQQIICIQTVSDTSGIFSCKTFFYYIFYVNDLVLPEK